MTAQPKPHTLVQHIAIVGAPSRLEPIATEELPTVQTWRAVSYAPSLLASFSPHDAEPLPPASAIAAFCMPASLRLRDRPPDSPSPQFACFVLTQGDGTRLYGHCLTTYERLPPTTEVQLGGASSSSSSQNAVTANAAAAAPAPADDSGPPLLGELVGRGEQCYAPRCVCLLSLAHFPLAFKASLLALHTMAQASGAPLALPVEACLTHLALNVPRPVPGGPTVRFALGNGAAPLHVDCAPPTQLPSTDYSVCELLGRLQPHGLVSLFHACMLEQQIVVVCDDDELRLAVCELALALLHPLEWAHVYVPTIPDDLLQLLSNPFPCILGLRGEQASHLPQPLPGTMAVLHVAGRAEEGGARLAMPRDALPSLPHREASELLSSLTAAARQAASGAAADETAANAASKAPLHPPPLASLIEASPAWADSGESALDDAAAALLEARTRGAFLRVLVSLLRDLHRFLPEETADGGAANGEGAPAADYDAQVDRWIEAQPSSSHAFLRDFVRTQLFLSFVEPPPSSSGPRRGRGGRCFQLVRDAFLQRELSQAADRERKESQQPLPLSVELLGAAAKKATDSEAASAPATAAESVREVHDVPPPAHAHAGPSAGYRYPDGLPTTLPSELCAAQIAVPVFEGELPPPPRISASVRAAWAEALAELEERNQKRGAAKLAAGVGGTLIVGGTAAALLCVVQ